LHRPKSNLISDHVAEVRALEVTQHIHNNTNTKSETWKANNRNSRTAKGK